MRFAGAFAPTRPRPFSRLVVVAADGEQQRILALEAGADDSVATSIRSELLIRIASLARSQRYQDTISRQAKEAHTVE